MRNFIINYLSIFKRELKPLITEPVIYVVKKTSRFRALKLFYAFFEKNKGYDVNERIVETPFVLSNLQLPKGARILDLGCNFSCNSIYLASLGYKVTGVDLNDYPFIHPNLDFKKGNLLDLDLELESYDAFVAVSTLEHCGIEDSYGSCEFPEGDKKIVQYAHKLLKKGGIMIITVPYGKRQIKGAPNGYRVYDHETLMETIKPFSVLKEEYFIGLGKINWLPADKNTLSSVSSTEKRFVQGVACLVLRK